MKIILTLLLAFTVSAAAFAQAKPTPTKPEIAVQAKKDSVFTIKLSAEQVKALLATFDAALQLLPRSADLTALQASEMQKQVYFLGKIINDQLPKEGPPPAKPPVNNIKK